MGGDSNKIKSDKMISTSIEHIIIKGNKLGATYVHIEPRELYLLIRYRVGNNLDIGTKLPIAIFQPMIEYIHREFKLSKTDSKKPIDKKIRIKNVQNNEIDMSIVPIIGGQKIVLKLNNNQSEKTDLISLGLWGDNLYIFSKHLQKHNGLTIVAGSNNKNLVKTLVYISKQLDFSDSLFASIGQEIENNLVSSIKIRIDPTLSGLNLADYERLRLLNNQNPKTIFISNIKDSEVIHEAAQISKNKQVYMSLVSLDIISLLNLLLSIKEKIELVNLSLVIYQKEVQKLCRYCRQSFDLPKTDLDKIRLRLGVKDFTEINKLESKAKMSGLGQDIADLNSTKDSLILYRSKSNGCNYCNQTGYIDKINKVELIDFSKYSINKFIHSTDNINSGDIEDYYKKTNQINLRTDALIKCLRGLIDYKDV